MIKQNGQEQYKCKFCEYSSAYKIGMQKHQSTHYRETSQMQPLWICKYSGQQSKNPYWNSASQNVKHGPVMRQLKKCENCGFITKDLTRHMQTHSNEKPFKCNTCNYAARQKEI